MDRIGERLDVAVDRRRQQLLDEERIALGDREDSPAHDGIERLVRAESVEQRRRLGRRQRVEHGRRAAEAPAAPVRPHVEQVGSREAEHEDRPVAELDERLDEVEERRRRPVHVLEDKEKRTLPREVREQAARREGRVFGVRRAGLEPDGGGELLGELRISEAGANPRRGVGVGERRQQAAKRFIRLVLRARAAAGDGGGRDSAKALRAFDGEARLADPGRAEDGDEVGPPVGGGALERVGDLTELALATDELGLEATEQRDGVGVDRFDRPCVASRRHGDGVPDGPPRPGGCDHLARGGAFLESRGLVHRRTGDQWIAGHDLPAREADPAGEAGRAERVRRDDRAQRVVVLRGRNAEHAEHAPAAERHSGRAAAVELPLDGPDSLRRCRPPRLRVVGRVGQGDVADQDRDQLARLDGSGSGRRGRDVVRRRTSHLFARREFERRVLLQHQPLELLQTRRRVDAELVVELAPEALERLQRLRMPSGAIERKDLLASQPFAQRMTPDQRVELRDDQRVTSQCQVGVDAFLETGQMLLGEPRLLQPGEGLLELGKRRAAPQCERSPQRPDGLFDLSLRERAPSLRVEVREGVQVE